VNAPKNDQGRSRLAQRGVGRGRIQDQCGHGRVQPQRGVGRGRGRVQVQHGGGCGRVRTQRGVGHGCVPVQHGVGHGRGRTQRGVGGGCVRTQRGVGSVSPPLNFKLGAAKDIIPPRVMTFARYLLNEIDLRNHNASYINLCNKTTNKIICQKSNPQNQYQN
jgi:hypothetical protein